MGIPYFSRANVQHEIDRDWTSRIKIFLYVLLRDMEFSIDPGIEIEKRVKWVSVFLAESICRTTC